MDAGDYGLVDTPKITAPLSVLVLEVDPSSAYASDYSILERYWSGWLSTMGIEHFRLLKTDIPANTKDVIVRFLRDN